MSSTSIQKLSKCQDGNAKRRVHIYSPGMELFDAEIPPPGNAPPDKSAITVDFLLEINAAADSLLSEG